MDNNLTEKQAKFLEVLFTEADGDFNVAAKMAGFSKFSKSWITEALQKQIIEAATAYLAVNSPKAVMAMVNVMDNPSEIGTDKKLAAAREILDRSGLSKIDRLQVTSDAPVGIFVLPAKDTVAVPKGTDENEQGA